MDKDFEYITSFRPYASDREYDEMMEFFETKFSSEIDEWYVPQTIETDDGTYRLVFEESGHERDSSQDTLFIYKKRI